MQKVILVDKLEINRQSDKMEQAKRAAIERHNHQRKKRQSEMCIRNKK